MNAAIRAALQAKTPELIAQYADIVATQYRGLVERFSPTMRGAANSSVARVWTQTVRPCCKSVKVPGDLSGQHTTYELDEALIAARAAAFATATIEAWEGKISAKMGELESAECHHVSGAGFSITGTRAGKSIRISQSMIINVSPKGLMFNQFPALIYVDGRKTSEAAYKKM